MNYEKWNKYKIGKIPFVNKNLDHPHRQVFIDYVIENSNTVIEVGPGEMIEYQAIKEHKNVEYSIVDVSDLFINNCKNKFPGVKIVKSAIEDLDIISQADVVYAASVLEHTRDVQLAIRKLVVLAKCFHFVMFKWSYGGNLKSNFNRKKKYWSSSFNVHQLLDEIRKIGTIEYTRVACRNGKMIDFEEYSKELKGFHRNGNYLMIHGRAL